MLEARYIEMPGGIRVKDKYVVHIPRVCSWSIVSWGNDRGYRSVTHGEINGPFATFVRNPLSRLVSAWRLTCVDEERYWDRDYTFPEFVRAVVSGCDDIHVRPQSQLIESPAFVGRYERLAADWRRCCEWLGVEHAPLPHLHRSYGKPWREHYTEELLHMAADFYRADLDAFEYEVPE